MPKVETPGLRIACIYWKTSSVGGIATHLNTLRLAAIAAGDQFDILHSTNWKTKSPQVFSERKWIRGGDTNIWVDGEVPQTEVGRKWLEQNYDAICFGCICPHETKAYPTQDFLPLYDARLPKIAWVMDGYWEDYSDWAIPLLPKLKGVLCPLASYASPLTELGVKNLVISPFPFMPQKGAVAARSKSPLLIWPNQWKNIKGVNGFMECIPQLSANLHVELYSNGIRYYQMRTEPRWKAAVATDHFQGHNGEGRADFFGNVDLPEIAKAYQRAWFTVNLQGGSTKRRTYTKGSYNNTEVEALWYGACPILHSSTLGTDMPKDVYIAVNSAEEIPSVVSRAMKDKFALNPRRQEQAREYVRCKHLAGDRYQELKGLL